MTFALLYVPANKAHAAAPTLSATGDYAAQFNGSNSYGVTTDAVIPSSGDYTVEAWVYDSSAADAMREIIAQGSDNASFFVGDIWGGTRASGMNDLPKIKRDQWFHVAVTKSSANGNYIWINGQPIGALWGLGNPSADPLNIGRQFGSYGEFWKGKIDEVKIWGTDRTADIATDMVTYGKGNGTGLLAYYDFNSVTTNNDGTFTVPDQSGASTLHPLKLYNMSSSDIVDVAEFVPWGNDQRDALVTFPRPYLNAGGGWVAPSGYEKMQALIVGGGGGGGAWIGGGGAGGGFIETAETAYTPGTKYTVSVGMGGSGAAYRDGAYSRYGAQNTGYNGGQTNFNGTIAGGGGKGGSYANFGEYTGVEPGTGANGGGASGADQDINGAAASTYATGGASNVNGGFPGGNQAFPWCCQLPAAGGGGAGGPGGDAAQDGRTGGDGGIGKLSTITGIKYAGGGGGAVHNTLDLTNAGVSGNGHDGGSAGQGPTQVGQSEVFASSAVANTGGGGGGAAMNGNYTSVGGDGASGVVILRLVAAAIAAQTTIYTCDGTNTINGIKVAAAHPKIFYIDSSDDEKMDANYLDYRVTSATARDDLWVEVSSFTGGKVTLANTADSAQPVGAVTAGGTGSAYFLAKASGSTTAAQAHTVKVYDRKPGSGGAIPLYTCSFSFTRVDDTVKASTNKVDSIATTTVSSLGTTFTITVQGDTGTIGAGNSVDGRLMWLSPASRSSWPTSALRLEDAAITTYSDAARTTVLKTYNNTLALNTGAGLSANTRQYYKAIYTFRIIGNAPAIASISPSAMISSGALVKHVGYDSVPKGTGTTVNVVAPVQEIGVTSSASKTTEVRSDGTTRITYTVTLENKGTKEASVDELHDHGDDGEDYVKGSSKKDGKSVDDAKHDDHDEHDYTFSGPIKVPAGGKVVYSYQVEVKTCKAGEKFEYEHKAEGKEGGSKKDDDEDHDGHDDDGDEDHDGKDDHDDHSEHVGSSATTDSKTKVEGKCGQPAVAVTTTNVVQAPDVSTGTAIPVAETTATVYGTVDSNGVSGLPVKFSYGTSPSLVGAATANLSASTTAAGPVAVSKALTGLTAGTRYYYRLTVTTPTGDKSGAIYHFDTQLPPGVPTAVTAPVTQILNTDNGALFTGAVTAARVSGGAKVLFEWATDSSNGACTTRGTVVSSGYLKDGTADVVFSNASATNMSYRATGLTASGKYCVRVVATHGAGFTTRVEGSWVAFTQAPKSAQSITFNSQLPPLPAGGTTTVSASATSLLPVTYTSNDTAVCTVDASTGAVVAVANSGVCSITATQDGDDTYYAATPQTLSFDIIPPVVTTTEVPRGEYGSGYTSTTLEADGGNGTFSNWTVVGTLPAGLTLSSAGVLSGTPTAAGVSTFGVTVESNGVTSAVRNYTIVIDSASISVTAADVTVAFGAAVPSVGFAYGDFVGSDTDADIALAPTCVTTYTVGANAGATGLLTACSGAWDENYAFTYVSGTATVNKFDVEVTAVDKSKQNIANGTVRPDPTFEYTMTPLPGGQTVANIFPTGVSFARATGEAAGDYAITPSASLIGSNYNVSFVDGTLTIENPQPVPALTATDFSVTYGEALGSGLTGSAKDGATDVPGTWVYTYTDADGVDHTVDSTTELPAGLYTIVAEFTPTDGVAYFGPVTTVLNVTVNKKVVTLSSDELEKQAGTLDPDLTYAASGFLPGDTISDLGLVEITRVAGEDPGTYVVTTSGGSNPNYTIAHAAAVLNITTITVNLVFNSNGTTARGFTVSCQAAKKGSTVTVDVDGTTIGTLTVNSNGTCPNTTLVIPNSVVSGTHVVTASGVYPSGRTGLTNFGNAVLPEPSPTPVLAPPGKPGTPAVVAADGSATLTWTAPTTGGAVASYVINSYPAGAVCSIVGLSASCTGLTNGVAYTFTVTAKNAAGTNESDPSAAATPVAVVVDDPNSTTVSEAKKFKGITGSFTFPSGSGFNIDKKGKVFVKVSSIYLNQISGSVVVTYKSGSAIKTYKCVVKEYGSKVKLKKKPTKRMLWTDPKGCQLPAGAYSELKSNVIAIKAVVVVKRYYATTGITKSPSGFILKPVKRTMFITVGAKG